MAKKANTNTVQPSEPAPNYEFKFVVIEDTVTTTIKTEKAFGKNLDDALSAAEKSISKKFDTATYTGEFLKLK